MAESNKRRPLLNKATKGPLVWIVMALLVVSIGALLFSQTGFSQIDTEQGLQLLDDDKVEQAKIVDKDQRVDLTLKDDFEVEGKDYGKKVQFFYVEQRGEQVVKAVDSAAPDKGFTDEVPKQSWLMSLLGTLIPFVIIFVVFWFLISQMSGGKMMNFGKSKAKLVNKENPDVTFTDVAGVDEALEELEEIKEFLAEPEKFKAVGAKIPKGVLLYGQPGTGKTLLAKAVAGEAGVPFYSISGSDFVEMDGFDVKTNVILIAATNRPDVLDPALLRPGRFDRQIPVEAPDMLGREHILEVHAADKPLADEVDLSQIAKRTPGFSGADLANVLNEAALLTAREGAKVIDNRILDEAIDRVIAGPQKRTRLMNDKERLVTAYHEGGHALVAAAMNQTDPVTKVTILPRGRALGYTMVLPSEDKYSTTRNELLDQLAYAMGGRVAEEIVFHDPTTGASNDIEKATNIARKMVTQYGMSEKLGMVKIGDDQSEPFAGRGYGGGDEYGDSTLSSIDREVRGLIDSAHADAYWALTHNRDVLDNLAYQLLERETLDQAALAAIFADVTKRPVREVWLAHDDRPVSERGPITPPTSQSDRNTGEGSGGAEVDTTDLPGAGPSGVSGPNVPHNPPGPQNPNDPGASGPGGPSTMGDGDGQNTNGSHDERGNDI